MSYVRSSDETRIHYRITGRPNGAPILFIQGLGADKNGWNLQRLATAPWYRGIALDNRGGRDAATSPTAGTRWNRWPTMQSPCSTTPARRPPMWSVPRWVAPSARSSR